MPSTSRYSKRRDPTTRHSLRYRVDTVLSVHAVLVSSVALILTTITSGWYLVVFSVIAAIVASLLTSRVIGYALRRSISTTHHGGNS